MINSLDHTTRPMPSLQRVLDGADLLWQKLHGISEPQPKRQLSAFHRAAQRAYQRFAVQQPRWANSLFDEHFLRTHAEPILSSIHRRGRWPTAYELALAWFAQLDGRMGEQSYERICAALPVAAIFLDLLQEEWTQQPSVW
jgi:hypothetical protein